MRFLSTLTLCTIFLLMKSLYCTVRSKAIYCTVFVCVRQSSNKKEVRYDHQSRWIWMDGESTHHGLTRTFSHSRNVVSPYMCAVRSVVVVTYCIQEHNQKSTPPYTQVPSLSLSPPQRNSNNKKWSILSVTIK